MKTMRIQQEISQGQSKQARSNRQDYPFKDNRPNFLTQQKVISCTNTRDLPTQMTVSVETQTAIDMSKEKLAIPATQEIRLIEIHNQKLGDKVMTVTTTYGNLSDIANLTLMDLIYGNGSYDKNKTDTEFVGSSVSDSLDMKGNAAYGHKHNVIMIVAGKARERDILHEVGHFSQNSKGYNGNTTNNILLEYHNVLLNENKYDNNIRFCYNAKNAQKEDKTWADLDSTIKDSKNKEILEEIATILTQKPYIDKYNGDSKKLFDAPLRNTISIKDLNERDGTPLADFIKAFLATEYFKSQFS